MLENSPMSDSHHSAEDSRSQAKQLLDTAAELVETDIQAALGHVDQALRLVNVVTGYEPLDDLSAECLHLQGRLLLNNSDYRAGLVSFSKAQSIYDALENSHGSAVELCFIGIAQAYVGLYADALKNMFEALEVFETSGHQQMISRSLNAIGYTYVLLHEPERALPYLLRSVQIARDSCTPVDVANCLHSSGEAYAAIGELDNALQSMTESVELCCQSGALIKEAEYLLGLGAIRVVRNEVDLARECFENSLSLARKHRYRFAESGALRRLGILAHQQNNTGQGRAFLEEALEISSKISAKQLTYLCLKDLYTVCKDSGDYETALDYFEKYHLAKEAIFSEQAEFRVKSLEVAYQLKEANREKEIFYLKNVALQREVDERVKAQAMAEHLAITDSLTGLSNRRQLLQVAEREVLLATRYGRDLSIIIFDIDHFKQVNDNFGHVSGDKVLQAVSKFVHNSVRKCDIVGRYGGEEFALLLPETNSTKAQLMFERIRTAIAAMSIELDRGSTSVTISAGIVQVDNSEKNVTLEQLLDRADQALYVAKGNGRNQTRVFGE
jgi:diguanylate cyclase (GGDEF)-like protein